MGTSKSFGGPKGSNPLLPPWAPPLEPEPDEGHDQPLPPLNPVPPPAWQGVLGQATKLAREGVRGASARSKVRSITRSYVRNRGGAWSAAEGSVAARRTATTFAGFLSDVARSGIDQALRNFNLEQYIGRSAVELLEGFAEALLPRPDSLDDAAANRAGLEAFYDLLHQYDALEEGIDALDALDGQGIQRAIENFISRYVSAAVLSVLSERIERGSATPQRCAEIHQALRSVITETVRLDFSGRDVVNMDWNGGEGERLIDRLLLDAYSLLEEE